MFFHSRIDFFPCSSLSPNHLQLVDFSSFYEVISIANPIRRRRISGTRDSDSSLTFHISTITITFKNLWFLGCSNC